MDTGYLVVEDIQLTPFSLGQAPLILTSHPRHKPFAFFIYKCKSVWVYLCTYAVYIEVCMCLMGVNDWLHPQNSAWMYATLKKCAW